MNTVVWTITVEWKEQISEDFDFDIVPSLSTNWNITIYFFWETDIKTSKDFIEDSKKYLWKIIHSDISISSEENVFLDPFDFEEWVYEVASFSWEQITFWEIKKRFEWNEEVISIREAEISKKFWNRVIKVDFVY